ncbi:hypothetical protein FB451DRAFT_1257897 [Mycena latifolia]|nr:hypothetical protein FB451DRAFT_1257897 [Mycena latifolia]
MLGQAVCTSFRRVNRVGLGSLVPPTLFRPRKYNRFSPDSTPSKLPARQPLPAAPEASTEPLVESDFPQYLHPLYEYGWAFDLSRQMHPKAHKLEERTILKRAFVFPTTAELVAFTENTRDAPLGSIYVFRNLWTDLHVRSLKGVTRSAIRVALEAETEYQKIVEHDFPPPIIPGPGVMSLEQAQRITLKKTPHIRAPPPRVPVEPVALPPAPPPPASPPPSICSDDLETYITPLVTNGWRIGGTKPMKKTFSEATTALRNAPCLHRTYYFNDYTSARHFLSVIVAAIPAPSPNSFAGVEVRLSFENCQLELWSISELAEGAHRKYGISHTDVRFAIEVENEFIKNCAGCAEHVAVPRRFPSTMDELWGSRQVTLH